MRYYNNNTIKRIRSTIASVLAVSSIIASAHIISHAVKYGAIFDDLSQPERVYQQDTFVPAGYFNDNPILVAISTAFSNDEYREIKAGINMLDECAKGMTFETIRTTQTERDDEQILILKDVAGKYTNMTTYGYALNDYSFRYRPEDYCGTIYLKNGLPIDIMKTATAHETCHLFDFQHARDHTWIMSAKIGYVNKTIPAEEAEAINNRFPPKQDLEISQ